MFSNRAWDIVAIRNAQPESLEYGKSSLGMAQWGMIDLQRPGSCRYCQDEHVLGQRQRTGTQSEQIVGYDAMGASPTIVQLSNQTIL